MFLKFLILCCGMILTTASEAQEIEWRGNASLDSASKISQTVGANFGMLELSHTSVSNVGDKTKTALDVALSWNFPLISGADRPTVSRFDVRRAWIVSEKVSLGMKLPGLGAAIVSTQESSTWGCQRDYINIDCFTSYDPALGNNYSNRSIAESIFIEGTWNNGYCWYDKPCGEKNRDGTFGPFPAIVVNHDNDAYLYGRCNDENRLFMICGGTPAGLPNWDPCSSSARAVPAQVYLAPHDYSAPRRHQLESSPSDIHLTGQDNKRQILRSEFKPAQESISGQFSDLSWLKAYTAQLAEKPMNHGLYGGFNDEDFSKFDAQLALEMLAAFECGENSDSYAKFGQAQVGAPPVELLKAVAEVENDFRCVEDSPESVCGGEEAARPKGCLFENDLHCQTGGIAASFNGEQNGELAIGDGDSGRHAPEFPYVVALINAGSEVVCSGSIVSDNQVLTASHCKCDHGSEIRAVFVGQKIGTTAEERRKFGGHAFSIVNSSMDDTELHYEPEFCSAEGEAKDALLDIALLEFENDEPLSEKYKVNVSPNLSPLAFYHSTIVGFGTSEEEAKGGTKRFAHGIPIAQCDPDFNESHSSSGCHPISDLVSVNDISRVDACAGDSGGPAFANFGLVGIIRGGINPPPGREATDCGYGGLYSKLDIETWSSREISFYEWFVNLVHAN